ncbi:MAG: amino acid transporter [Gammaproteobacteria bacterium RIFCSPHIGHO2_12_FULL_35_23]|nr:MAG: amino acid transporter [Gammaproteobacteria bacterium RIFCSPHIGHO2_12_FULL_35_23]
MAINIKQLIFGKALNPFQPKLFQSLALISFFAWIGLGADGLSSSCYGPEEAFRALNGHPQLAIFVAIATVITVFIIALGYNQVVELFPSGGGGYKVATQLLGKQAGLVSGCALIVDYILTIALSTASGTDALFSFLPANWAHFRVMVEAFCIAVLVILNLRGMKESIQVLLPIFLGFLLTHIILITYGIFQHGVGITDITVHAVQDTHGLITSVGIFAVLAFLLHSYSLGSGTYTGLEAVSNNVNRLAEPRVRTGKVTMLYMAISLSFMAGGITLLYLFYNVVPVGDKTLNAIAFQNILGFSLIGHVGLVVTLCFEAGILLVAANTGFLAGPQVLANMAVDNWLPHRFTHLSNRLVTKNGILLYGLAALIILFVSEGKVSWLVVLYSINVFITFTLTLLGLSVYWFKHRSKVSKNWPWRLGFSLLGFIVTASILLVTILVKFTSGGWVTILITGLVIGLCFVIHSHYGYINKRLRQYDLLLAPPLDKKTLAAPVFDINQQTAILFLNEDRCVGMHALLSIQKMFPDFFKNYVFLSVGEVDIESFSGVRALNEMQVAVEKNLDYFVEFCHQHGLATEAYTAYGPDVIEKLVELAEKIKDKYPRHIFFASRLTFDEDTLFNRILHNETPLVLQRRLHAIGEQLVVLPMQFDRVENF